MMRVTIIAMACLCAATSVAMNQKRETELASVSKSDEVNHDLIKRAYDDDDAYEVLIAAINAGVVRRTMLDTIDAEKLFGFTSNDDVDKLLPDERIAFVVLFPANEMFAHFIKTVTSTLAHDGDADACYSLGYCNEFGRAMDKNMPTAIAWYVRAASKGHVAAQARLSLLYLVGKGVAKDHAASLSLASAASINDDALALFLLGMHYRDGVGVKNDLRIAVGCFKKAARLRHGDAVNALGVMAHLGHGMEANDNAALNYFSLAASMGVPAAMTNLGHMYEHGIDVDRSIIAAKYWYELAASLGERAAQRKLNSPKKNSRAIWIRFYFFEQDSWRPVETAMESL